MSLKEQFIEVINDQISIESGKEGDSWLTNQIDAAEECVDITIEFAKGFAKWMDDQGYSQNVNTGDWEGISTGGNFPIDELIKKYETTISK